MSGGIGKGEEEKTLWKMAIIAGHRHLNSNYISHTHLKIAGSSLSNVSSISPRFTNYIGMRANSQRRRQRPDMPTVQIEFISRENKSTKLLHRLGLKF